MKNIYPTSHFLKINLNIILPTTPWYPQWSLSLRWGNLRKRDHWGYPGVVGRIILRWIFRKWYVGVWTGLGWLRIETGGEQL
jgi:hypothetical protein